MYTSVRIALTLIALQIMQYIIANLLFFFTKTATTGVESIHASK